MDDEQARAEPLEAARRDVREVLGAPVFPGVHDGVPDGFVPDSVESYPVAKAFAATLPSGARFLLRRPNLLALMQRGDIPNPLIGAVQEAIAEGELGDRARELAVRAELAGRTPQEQWDWENENGLVPEGEEQPVNVLAGKDETSNALEYIEVIVFGSVLKPELSFDPPAEIGGRATADGKLSMKVVEDTDKMFIFQWASSQLEGIATFREDGAVADPVGDRGEVRAAP